MRRIKNNVLEICGEENEVIFSMEEKFENNVFYIKLRGEIKNEVAYEFEDELMAALLSCNQVELNFEHVDYVASMVLKILLSAQQMIDEMNNSTMCINGASENVKTRFKEAGFYDILEFKNV